MKRHPARGAPLAILALLMAAGFPLTVGAQVAVVGGSIHPAAIEVDNNSNHFPASAYPTGFSNGLILNAGAAADWVKDIANNTDPPSLSSSIATGIDPTGASTGGVPTGAPGGKGHWNGARVVDGIGGGDQDIFLTGGKENDVTTWNIGPGTVGSSKYDASQAYLANNQTHVFFGMERRGNNGTTAFDFEFNKLPPLTEAQLLALGFSPAQAAALKDLIPNRSVGDTLCTFEMQGSGGSGSAVPFIFRWNGTAYVEDPTLLAGVFTSINDGGPNDTNAVPSPPWGHVNSKGVWDLSNLQRFEFAEAAVPLSVLGTSGCGGAAFVQIRTRSSSTENSDLKDTTKVFQFVFGGPTAAATLGTNCLQQFTFDGSTSTNSTGGSTGLTYQWTFTVSPATATLGAPAVATATPGVYTATGVSGTVPVTSGVAATVTAQLKVVEGGASGCEDTLDSNPSITVYPLLSVTASLSVDCDGKLSFDATPSGGKAPYTYAWSIERNVSGMWVQVTTSTNKTGTFTISVDGDYRAVVTVTDTADTSAGGKPQCQATGISPTVAARLPLNPSVTKGQPASDGTAVTMNGSAHAADSVVWQVRDADTSTSQGAQPGPWITVKTDPNSANDLYSLLYGSFKTHDTTPTAINFVFEGVPYTGRKYEVEIRISASRTLNGVLCSADSAPVKISYIEAVDPKRGRQLKRVQ